MVSASAIAEWYRILFIHASLIIGGFVCLQDSEVVVHAVTLQHVRVECGSLCATDSRCASTSSSSAAHVRRRASTALGISMPRSAQAAA